MARKAIIEKQKRLYEDKFIKQKTTKGCKYYNRCRVCGRSKSFIREFWVCRVCFRKYAREGLIMWVRKSSR